MAAQKALQHPEPKRPYGLTEDDHIKLHRTRNVLRLFQYMSEDKHQSQLEPELLGDFYCLLADQQRRNAPLFASPLAQRRKGIGFDDRHGQSETHGRPQCTVTAGRS